MHKKTHISFLVFTFLVFSFYNSNSQTDLPKGWHLLDIEKDSIAGISLNKAYQFLQSKKLKSKTIIVGVLDSGVDTLQEDLKNVLWHNPKEIPFNGIDDDKNGYTDDIYGWNFLGNNKGQNVDVTTKETIRFYHKHKDKFLGKKIEENNLSNSEKRIYQIWMKCAASLNVSQEKAIELTLIKMALNNMKNCAKIIKKDMDKDDFTAAELEKFKPTSNEVKNSKQNYLTNIMLLQIDGDEKNSAIISQLEEHIKKTKEENEAKENEPEDERKKVIKEDYENFNFRQYGNYDVKSKDPMHGTHVSGIIAAQRNNNKGMDGVADDVKIMAVRVVPDGDEYDKDVALGIMYAVDNGAKVINMSFGKEISPEKYWVDSAYKYAASKDVLIVHASGNETANIDSVESFPCSKFLDGSYATNVITVGASTDPKISGSGYVADFSNYGKNEVDVFAPGVKIYSTVTGENNYSNQKGTSMAAPVVAGIAALIRSYFPSLTAVQVKEIIQQSVFIPNENNLAKPSIMGITIDGAVKLKDACKTGGIVNAAKAVEMAWKKTNSRKVGL